ncbi:transcriptional regulator [Arenicella chitinivorans]|uniref:Transcriptional regulator n=1 Tax=Arenicella chitinivorans TaxID=1329800 RepID=A0A918RIK5_9GAMM|nr:helix-turn-helix domain-containing protein [Arenicella chitinivorans]GHA00286.1 transcriptional regulator [Arenicella chitinivorans]
MSVTYDELGHQIPPLHMSNLKSDGVRAPNSFGERLRVLRARRKLSQLRLAEIADTTPRHISFIETGRSRPGLELVQRLCKALELNISEQNILLTSAGLPINYIPYRPNGENTQLLANVVEAVLTSHDPYPACAVDTRAQILFENTAFQRLFPGMSQRSPEQSIDDFFASTAIRKRIANWSELAWAFIDRRRFEVARSGDPKLVELTERALAHMQDVRRPEESQDSRLGSMVMYPKLVIEGKIYSTYMTVLRFEGMVEAALSDIRIEMIYPMDEAADALFHRLAR